MNLRQLKNILWRTEYGKYFPTNTLCSEPIPIKTAEGMNECCFWCRYDWKKNIFTAPFAKVVYNAERAEGISLVSCDETPSFSMGPKEILHAEKGAKERADNYPKFEEMYDLARPIFYKENCSDEEKRLLSDFYTAFKNYVDSALMVFYRELVPSFFEWLEGELANAGDKHSLDELRKIADELKKSADIAGKNYKDIIDLLTVEKKAEIKNIEDFNNLVTEVENAQMLSDKAMEYFAVKLEEFAQMEDEANAGIYEKSLYGLMAEVENARVLCDKSVRDFADKSEKLVKFIKNVL